MYGCESMCSARGGCERICSARVAVPTCVRKKNEIRFENEIDVKPKGNSNSKSRSIKAFILSHFYCALQCFVVPNTKEQGVLRKGWNNVNRRF